MIDVNLGHGLGVPVVQADTEEVNIVRDPTHAISRNCGEPRDAWIVPSRVGSGDI